MERTSSGEYTDVVPPHKLFLLLNRMGEFMAELLEKARIVELNRRIENLRGYL